jgi:hypothetical protein
MTSVSSIRSYERADLDLGGRLPSLARRFPSLKGAGGLEPWNPAAFHAWIAERGEGGAAWHAGLLLLNLWGAGPWPPFDLLAAARVWEDGDKQMFVNWLRVWKFDAAPR